MRIRAPFRLLTLAGIGTLWLLTPPAGVQAGKPTAGQAPPIPAQQIAPNVPPTGTARVSGRVIADDDGAPINRVMVSITGGTPAIRPAGAQPRPSSPTAAAAAQAAGTTPLIAISTLTQIPVGGASSGAPTLPPGMIRRETESDAAGRFEFRDLPAGRFSLMVQRKTGFVAPKGVRAVQLAEGAAESVTFRLVRTGAITGRVLDESGEPLARAMVRANRFEVSVTFGRYPAGTMSSATTDERGIYRIFDLQPGEYVVATEFMNPLPQRTAVEGPRTGYVQTFHPSTVKADESSVVTVRAGQDTANIDISMQRAQLGEVTGQALDAKGDPLASQATTVRLVPRNSGMSGSFVSGITTKRSAGGQFVISNVPPGDYYLVATTGRNAVSGIALEAAYVPVTVNGDEVTANIQTNLGATVSGRIVVEGPPLPVPPMTYPGRALALQVRAVPERGGPGPMFPMDAFPANAFVTANEDGSFELKGLRGPIRLATSGGVGVQYALRRGGRDITDVPLELVGTEHIENLEIVMTTATGTLSGRVLSADGTPAGGARVVVFPEQPGRWFGGSALVRNAMSLDSLDPAPTGADRAWRPRDAGPQPWRLHGHATARRPILCRGAGRCRRRDVARSSAAGEDSAARDAGDAGRRGNDNGGAADPEIAPKLPQGCCLLPLTCVC